MSFWTEQRTLKSGEIRHRGVARVSGFRPLRKTFPTEIAARRWAAKAEAELLEGNLPAKERAERHTAPELIDRYIEKELPTSTDAEESKAQKKKHLLWWRAQLKHKRLGNLSLNDVIDGRIELMQQPGATGKKRGPATANRYAASLFSVLSWGLKIGWLVKNPCEELEPLTEPVPRVRILTWDELRRYFAAILKDTSLPLELVVWIAITAGPRKGEILKRKLSDVKELPDGTLLIEVTHSKTKKRRSIYVEGFVRDKLKEHIQSLPAGSIWLFPSRTGLHPINIDTAHARARKIAQIEDFRFHDLRHCAASFAAMLANGSLNDLMLLLNHTNPAQTARYTHLTTKHMQALSAKIGEGVMNAIAASAADHDSRKAQHEER